MQPRGQLPGSFYSTAAPGSAMFCPLPGIPDSWDSGKRDSLPSLAAAPVWTRAGPVWLMYLQREEGHRSPLESAWHMETQSASQATSLQQPPWRDRHPACRVLLTRMLWRLKTLCRWRGGVCSELTGDGYSIGLVSVGELAHRPSGTYS